MSEPAYQVLSRRWRPRQFADVVGQETATRILTNAIESGRIGHAYLFCGPRGVGKTTTARILARGLNCETGPTATPCGVCDPCRSILDGRSLDVIEIDAASNNRVEDVRDLRERVRYVSSSARMKVYIVDEVHMLSTSAFNAFLKTLEEPPPNVVFIFATTAPERVPETILSRCQVLEFRAVDAATIARRLADLAERESVAVEPGALSEIARRAAGSVRDGETLLEQALASGVSPLTADAVAEVLGLALPLSVDRIAQAIADRDAREALLATLDALDRGQSPAELGDSLTTHLRDVLVVRVAGVTDQALHTTAEQEERLRARAAALDPADILRMIHVLVDATAAMRRSHAPRILLEAAVVQLAELDRAVDLSELLDRLRAIESRLEGGTPAPRPLAAPASTPARAAASAGARDAVRPPAAATPRARESEPPRAMAEIETPPIVASLAWPVATPAPAPAPAPAVATLEERRADPLSPTIDWSRMIGEVSGGDRMLGTLLEEAQLVSYEDGVLTLDVADSFARSTLEATHRWGPIRSALAAIVGPGARLRRVVARIGGRGNAAGATAGDSLAPPPPPPHANGVSDAESETPPPESLLSRVVSLFDGEVIPHPEEAP